MKATALALLISLAANAADLPSNKINVDLKHEDASFKGELTVSVIGTFNKARTKWLGSIQNTSSEKIARVVFCISGIDSSGKVFLIDKSPCLIRTWVANWEPGKSYEFKGDQRAKLSALKDNVSFERFEISVLEMLSKPENIVDLPVRCSIVWPNAIRVLADKKFRPTVLDKETFTATFAYEGGRIDGYSSSRQMLKTFTTASTALFGPSWDSFRIDSASLYLKETVQSGCVAEIKLTMAGYEKDEGWIALESNFTMEGQILKAIKEASKSGANEDLDKGISEISSRAPTTMNQTTTISVTSEPSGAEIEVNGEYVGSSPSTISEKSGQMKFSVRKSGFYVWERTLTVNPGDSKTVHADLEKK